MEEDHRTFGVVYSLGIKIGVYGDDLEWKIGGGVCVFVKYHPVKPVVGAPKGSSVL